MQVCESVSEPIWLCESELKPSRVCESGHVLQGSSFLPGDRCRPILDSSDGGRGSPM